MIGSTKPGGDVVYLNDRVMYTPNLHTMCTSIKFCELSGRGIDNFKKWFYYELIIIKGPSRTTKIPTKLVLSGGNGDKTTGR